ncbi:Integral membrane family protein [Mycena chlorophos]|uniref:Integral membrane family protein n=1 Tax=Mycena chlorophos TaxID=658473 RepID=A0A8H6S1K9_MYCCL|nr:Integral membrane family protein [Mycena chlorophos]
MTILSLVLPTLLAAHGLRKKSLSPSGAATAFVVGLVMISGPSKVWGASLIAFYLIGSRATKYGKNKKKTLEAGYEDYGNRSGWQVLSNSFSAVAACTWWNLLFDPLGLHALVLGSVVPSTGPAYSNGGWCALSRDVSDGKSRALLFAALGHFACCLGDTLASELGILSSSPPRLITTGKVVPPGAFMSICLILENATCRSEFVAVSRDLCFWGAIGGLGGSALDSLLGATIQMTRYDESKKLIVEDHAEGSPQLKLVNGLNVLTNNQVNVVSSVVSALAISLLA